LGAFELEGVYTFTYHPEKKSSDVTDILGNRTAYFWDGTSHIQRIDYFSGDKEFHSAESFVWERLFKFEVRQIQTPFCVD
jgi:hypothetical protein